MNLPQIADNLPLILRISSVTPRQIINANHDKKWFPGCVRSNNFNRLSIPAEVSQKSLIQPGSFWGVQIARKPVTQRIPS